MNKLENARKEINRIDKEITKLFEERMKQMEDVIIYKMENNLQILDAGREKEVIERNCKILVNKETVAKFAAPSTVLSFARYKVGDGIEKKEENFAEEVAAQIRG